MTKITRTLKKYVYTFGTVGRISENGTAEIIIVKTLETYEKIGSREIKRISDELKASLLYTDEKEVKAETSLEEFIKICELTEI